MLKTLTSPQTLDFPVHQPCRGHQPCSARSAVKPVGEFKTASRRKTKTEFRGYTRATRAAVATRAIPEILTGLSIMPTRARQVARDGVLRSHRLALLICRIRSRISRFTAGRPDLERHRQNRRKPWRRHWTTVAGLTNTITSRQRGR